MPMKAWGGGRDMAPPHWQSGTRRRWVVGFTPRLLYPRERPVPIVWKAGKVLGPPLSLTVKVNTDRNNIPYASIELL